MAGKSKPKKVKHHWMGVPVAKRRLVVAASDQMAKKRKTRPHPRAEGRLDRMWRQGG